MIKSLTKHGNSYALIIDRPILDLLKIDPEAPVEVSTDGDALTVRRAPSPLRPRSKVAKSLAKVNARHAKALKRLAE